MTDLSGTSTLLIGGPGSGKTYSLSTFVEAGIELFCVFTEPGGEEALLQSIADRGIDISAVHWQYIAPASPSFETMLSAAKTISTLSYEGLTSIKSGIEKSGYRQFVTLLECLSNFTDQRTGEVFGPVDSWGPDRAIVLDSLSGLNMMAMDMVAGAKPVKHPGEWGVAMDAEERLVAKLCADTRAFFVLTAHLERETNELTGALQIMAGALGKKLAPRLPRFFSDVVCAYRDGDEFLWSTTLANVDLKARTLPLHDKLPASFGTIVKAWKERAATASASTPNAGAAAGPQHPTAVSSPPAEAPAG